MKNKNRITIALCGNPNTGKSTVFNALTGGKQEVGNWPGKTVEKKWGPLRGGNGKTEIIDLPGTYSLTAYSPEEIISRNFIIEKNPDVVVNIVDASNLERNLYLTVQLMELGANVVIALNMMDLAEKRGMVINSAGLSRLLGVPVVPMVANRKKGIKTLINEMLSSARIRFAKEKLSIPCMTCTSECLRKKKFKIDYGKDLEPGLEKIEKKIKKRAPELAKKYGSRWLAIKLVEKDSEIIKKIKKTKKNIYDSRFRETISKTSEIYEGDVEAGIADKRYGFINGILKKTVSRRHVSRITGSDRIDCILTNRFLGIPIFLATMYLLYQFIFIVGEPFSEAISHGTEIASIFALNLLDSAGSPDWFTSLVISGIIDGVGNVLVLVPNIALLFAAIAFLEDSGYMARAAFIMENIMRKVGLNGRAFISVIVAFGCNVPAVMSTRTIESRRDRMTAILANPIIPCSARTILLVFLASIFFPPEQAGQVVFGLLVLSVLVFMLVSKILRSGIFPGGEAQFVMELPPYQLPTVKAILMHTWERTKAFIYKAGSIILVLSVVIWFLASNPSGCEYGGEGSYIGDIGKFFSPVFSPLGFGWKETTALLTGFVAKESMISTLGVLYGEDLGSILSEAWSPEKNIAFMVFSLLYIPCLATVAVIKNETKSWKWAGFAVAYLLVLAWIFAFAALKISAFFL